jgi:putrescine aminotransferase
MALSAKFAGRGATEASALGCEVRLSDGRTALDFGCYAVHLLGHRNAAVVAAVRKQLDTMPVSTRSLANPVQAVAAEALSDYLGGHHQRVYFGLNGSDVVEVAVKLARLATGRATVLAVRGGFHGKSLGALALTHASRFRATLDPLLCSVRHIDPADAGAVREHAASGDVAAVVFEPIQGENGVTSLDPVVLRTWVEDAKAAGAFSIADEIQVGLRRAGHRSLSAAWDLPVDGVLFGKPLGGGVVPASALLCTDELYRPLLTDPFLHSATFAGNPLSTAAIPAALREIERHAPKAGIDAGRLEDGLRHLAAEHSDVITAVRGHGLIWGLDVARPELAGEIQIELAANGLLVSPCLSRPEVVRLLPPIITKPSEVDRALGVLDAAIGTARVESARALEGSK